MTRETVVVFLVAVAPTPRAHPRRRDLDEQP
jgi:hypothetical protein